MKRPQLVTAVLAFVVATAWVIPPAHADQCAWNNKKVAERGARLVEKSKTVVLFCELCDGDRPQQITVTSVDVRQASMGGQIQQGYWEVFINGKPVDMAYVFVEGTSAGAYKNLGIASECGADGVSREITHPYRSPKGRYKDWYGKFTSANRLVTIAIKPQKLHGPHWLKIRYYVISNEYGDNRGELFGYLHMDKKVPTYVTPFPGCHLYFERQDWTITVRDNGKCGAAARGLTGQFKRKAER